MSGSGACSYQLFSLIPYNVASKISDSIHFEFEREELVYFRNGKQEGLVRRVLGLVPSLWCHVSPCLGPAFEGIRGLQPLLS